jgi:hypothetical protein
MEFAQSIQPGAGVLTLAAGAIVAGALLFSSGLSAARLRARFRRLEQSRLRDLPTGFAHVRGRVALESPLFAPLTSTPCAGFQLEVRVATLSLCRTVEECRDFRLEDAGVSALVSGERGRWSLAPTARRELAADQPISQGMTALLERVPESLWWREAGGALQLTEFALPAGAECHVVGTIRHAAAPAVRVEAVRTGTDDGFVPSEPHEQVETVLSIGPEDPRDFMLVSDGPPGPDHLRVPALRMLGILVGPALSLTGMLFLASAAERLRALGRF